MATTQRELAKHLGMSRQIVGHALNGNPRVAESTRRKVLTAAARFGYTSHSNQEARSLIARRYGKRVRHDLIAVMMGGEFEGGLMRDMPYFNPLFHGIEAEAVNLGVDVALHTMRINHLPRYILEKRVDGIIGFETTPERNLGLFEEGIPVMTVGARHKHTSSIIPDDYRGIQLTTQHLIDRGHRRIGYIGQSPNFPGGADRLKAFRATMKRNGLDVDEKLVEVTLLQPYANAGRDGMTHVLQRSKDFTAIVCYNDTIAIGVIDILRSQGLRVPHDVSVVGFDDVSREYKFKPTLTSISFDRHAMGRRAVSLLYEILEQVHKNEPDAPLPLRHEVFPVELVVRNSTRALSS